MTEDLAWAVTYAACGALLALLIIGMTAMIIVIAVTGTALLTVLAAFAVRALRRQP